MIAVTAAYNPQILNHALIVHIYNNFLGADPRGRNEYVMSNPSFQIISQLVYYNIPQKARKMPLQNFLLTMSIFDNILRAGNNDIR